MFRKLQICLKCQMALSLGSLTFLVLVLSDSCKNHSIITPVQYELSTADTVKMPNRVDSNSPCWWVKDSIYILNSFGHPWISQGKNFYNLSPAVKTKFTNETDGARWIESVFQENDSTLFGWYHQEPQHFIPEEIQKGRDPRLTAPHIGACYSVDNGNTWRDLGVVLKAPDDSWNLQTINKWFAGGHGDFTVIADQNNEYFYFFFSCYVSDSSMQGISLARMKFSDRMNPQKKVFKYYNKNWDEPGLGGKSIPIYAVRGDWHKKTPDAFWGPSVHYNTYLKKYVILMNRAIDEKWKQEGIYISFSDNLSDLNSYTKPEKIITNNSDKSPYAWYPQVIGLDFDKKETDSRAGKRVRLFIRGISVFELEFE